QLVGEDLRALLDLRLYFSLQGGALAVGDVLDVDLARLAIEQAHDQLFASTARAGDLRGALVRVHVARLATDKGFVGFNRATAAHLLEGPALHGETNTVKHEPCGFLRYSKRTVNLKRADAVLAVGNHPHSRKPLCKRQRGILEYSPDLHRELAA